MGLLKLASSAKMRKEAAKLAKSQPKTFHSQGPRPKTVQLTGGRHRDIEHHVLSPISDPGKGKEQKINRGTFPMLILLRMANGFTAGVGQRMMKCAGLLSWCEEALPMKASESVSIRFAN